MANIFLWLFAAVVPLAKKILVGLGIGWITYEGLSLVGTQVQNAVVSSWGSMGSTTLSILALAGFSQSVGIILAALTARIALVAVGRLGKVTT